MSSVKVAVRVRPFNKRELELASSGGTKLCIEMNGNSTTINNFDPRPNEKASYTFAFDYSYWSHDGFFEENGLMKGQTSKYADQDRVFNELGREVLDNAFEGYNACLFAYGQTGSGKSYSMIGYQQNAGIVPKVCGEIFQRIKKNTDPDKRFEVSVSMLEIYNECVQDLLVHPKNRTEKSLKVAEDPRKGVYVMGLTSYLVDSYKEIAKKLDEGSMNRTVGETNMNQTSSRAHTVFRINFKQVFKINGEETYKTSDINLVDLAGSERAGSTGATGDRLKEGCNINQSLSTLGKVISALAEKSSGKFPKNGVIPYRDSKLTRILQSALGGNSKTTMIAALSPSFANYEETLSTLRYADRVKQIKNSAVINEDPAAAQLRQLQEENAKLLALLHGRGLDVNSVGDSSINSAEVERVRKEYEAKMEEMRVMQMSYEERLKLQKENEKSSGGGDASNDNDDVVSYAPDLRNLSDDPQLTGRLKFNLKPAENILGRPSNENGGDGSVVPDIPVVSSGVLAHHATLELGLLGAQDELLPVSAEQLLNSSYAGRFGVKLTAIGKVLVNGVALTPQESRLLIHKDVISFGSLKFFIFWDPKAAETDGGYPEWEDVVQLTSAGGGLLNPSSLSSADEEKIKAETEKRIQEDQQRLQAERQAIVERQAQFEQQMMQREAEIASKDRAEAARIREILRREKEAQQRELEVHQKALEEKERVLAEERNLRRQREEEELRSRRVLEGILAKAMLLVEEANNMADDLGKAVLFSCQLVTKHNEPQSGAAESKAGVFARSEIAIKVEMLDDEYGQDGSVYSWSLDVFEERLFRIRDLWNAWARGDDGTSTTYPDDDDDDDDRSGSNRGTVDPFSPDKDARVSIGEGWLYLDSLRGLMSVPKEIIGLFDGKGVRVGGLSVGMFLKLMDVKTEEEGEEELLLLDSLEDLKGRRVRITLVLEELVEFEKVDFCREVVVRSRWVDGGEIVAMPLNDEVGVEFQLNARTGKKMANVTLNYARDYNLTLTEEIIGQLNNKDLTFEVSGRATNESTGRSELSMAAGSTPGVMTAKTLRFNETRKSIFVNKVDIEENIKLKEDLAHKNNLLEQLKTKLGGEEALLAFLSQK